MTRFDAAVTPRRVKFKNASGAIESVARPGPMLRSHQLRCRAATTTNLMANGVAAHERRNDLNDKPEEKSKPIHQQGAARSLELADPARGDDPGEFQGYHHDAGVSFIVR